MSANSKKPLRWLLSAVFLLAMFMGTGPGVLLVNQPRTIAGLPWIYAWGILWYAVLVAVALIAFGCLWRGDADTSGVNADDAPTGTEDAQ